jgi:hypothetical protein
MMPPEPAMQSRRPEQWFGEVPACVSPCCLEFFGRETTISRRRIAEATRKARLIAIRAGDFIRQLAVADFRTRLPASCATDSYSPIF